MRFRERLRQTLSVKEPPHRIAAAFALGVFIGMSPLLGLHTVLGLAAATLFGLNRLVTIVGVYVTNPWTIIPIYTFSTWVGARVLGLTDIMPHIDWRHLTFSMLLNEFRPLILPFFFGTTLIGILSAGVSYVIVLRFVRRNRA